VPLDGTIKFRRWYLFIR